MDDIGSVRRMPEPTRRERLTSNTSKCARCECEQERMDGHGKRKVQLLIGNGLAVRQRFRAGTCEFTNKSRRYNNPEDAYATTDAPPPTFPVLFPGKGNKRKLHVITDES